MTGKENPGEIIINTQCRFCEVGCGIEAHVQDGRLIEVKGFSRHPTSQGIICVRAKHAPEIVHSPLRLTSPLLRTGDRGSGNWREISWENALELLAERLGELKENHGAESVGLYRGAAGDWGAPWHYVLRFMNGFGSPNVTAPSHICYFPRYVAENVTYGSIISPDYKHADVIVEWGACRPTTHIPYWLMIRERLKQGSKLIVVDPVLSSIAKQADLWLQIRPGTDGALALSLMQVLIEDDLVDHDFVRNWTVGFDALAELAAQYPPERAAEITGIPAEMIREAAHLMAATGGSTSIYAGNGVEHHTNTFYTMRAISCLRALLGTLDVPGGNVFLQLVPWKGLKGKELLPPGQIEKRLGRYDLFTDGCSVIPFPEIVDSILTEKPYPLRALLVMAGNPVVVMPNPEKIVSALKKLDFLVVADPFMTKTAALADLVLPGTTQYEQTGFICSSMFNEIQNYVLIKQKVVEVEGAWSDWKILYELSKRLQLDEVFPWSDVEEAIDAQLAPSGITVSQLKAHPEGIRFTEEDQYRKYEEEGFGTPSGKVEFVSKTLEERGYEPLPVWAEPAESPVSQPEMAREYPLIGCSAGRLASFTHSQFRHVSALRGREPEPWTWIHPRDAQSRGVQDGDMVRISSPLGSIQVRAKVTDSTQQGVLLISSCWGEDCPEGNMNLLVDDQARDPVSGTTGSRSFLCQVERLL
jgi:anaerobic selenocysteine-containing dehydrogenase